MVSFKSLTLLALTAASAIAAPHRQQHGHKDVGKKVVWETVVHTAYVTVRPGGAPKTKKPEPVITKTVVYGAPKPTPKVEYKPARPPAPKPESKPPVYQPSNPPPSNAGYMGLVDEWRSKLGLPKLQYDTKLENNARKTCNESGGKQVHQLNPGSQGQVLAPGKPDQFYKVFVGGWLCERPNVMGGVCSSASQGWEYHSTGHADILMSPKYKKIGCACALGIWACDVSS
jgi:hypothetical protein